MKIRILSDLHIEFFPFDIPGQPADPETVLVLAGDIGVITDKRPLQFFLQKAAAQFRAVVMVLGNHEYYRSIWPDALDELRGWAIAENVYILEKSVVAIDDVTFLGATLWSDFEHANPLSMAYCQACINDFSLIGARPESACQAFDQRPRPFSPAMALEDHYAARAWLATAMATMRSAGRKTVVVTHHGVAPGSINPKYIGSSTNGAFVSDLSALLIAGQPSLVIHGHVHDSVNYCLDSIEHPIPVVANPRGYTKRSDTQENKRFDPLLTVEV